MNYLTQNYKDLFNSSGWIFAFVLIKKTPFLIKDIITSGKVRETISFIIWEILYCCNLFKKSNFLKFNLQKPIILNKDDENNLKIFKQAAISANYNFKVEISPINWKILLIEKNSNIIGVTLQNNKTLILSSNKKDYRIIHEFESPVESIFQSKNGNLYVCINGKVFKSENYKDFKLSLLFKDSKSIFRHNCGMTETSDGMLLVGEYGSVWNKNNSWEFLANLYFSNDNGISWHLTDFLKNAGVNKHIHLVKYIKQFDHLILTDGDNHKFLWKFDCSNPNKSITHGWDKTNKYHIQKGGYTSVVETETNLLFGSDYLGGTNFIVKTEDLINFKYAVLPEPYKRNAISALDLRKNNKHNEIWAEITSLSNFSKCKGLIMYSDDEGETWNKFIEFSGKYQDVTIISSCYNIENEIYLLIRPTDKTDSRSFTLRICNND